MAYIPRVMNYAWIRLLVMPKEAQVNALIKGNIDCELIDNGRRNLWIMDTDAANGLPTTKLERVLRSDDEDIIDCYY